MSGYLFICFALFLVPIVISRLIMEKALGRLEGETKLKLLDAFAKQRKYSLYFVLPVILVYLLTMVYFANYATPIAVSVLGAFIVYGIARNTYSYRKMKALEVPADYLRAFKRSAVLTSLGFIALLVYIFWNHYHTKAEGGKGTAYQITVSSR